MNYQEFESEYGSDEEVESDIDSLVSFFTDDAGYENEETSVINPLRLKHLVYTYKVMKYLARNSSVKVTYELNQPYNSIGSVSVEGKNICIRKTEWLTRAAKLASNLEVYPKTNGDVCMTFTFHGLTTQI